MAHFFILAMFFKIPIALLRILLSPIGYIFSSILSVVTNVQRYILTDQPDNLGPATSQHDTISSYSQEKNKLLNALSASATSKVLFVTVEVGLRKDHTSRISDVAVSGWSPDKKSREIKPTLWIIENNDLSITDDIPNQSAFLSSTTLNIQEDEIATNLTGRFQTFTTQFQKVYLAGYRINDTLSLMRGIWVLPQDITTIDTERIWQAQQGKVTNLSLHEWIEGSPEPEHGSRLEGTAAKAWLGMEFLKYQIKQIQNERAATAFLEIRASREDTQDGIL